MKSLFRTCAEVAGAIIGATFLLLAANTFANAQQANQAHSFTGFWIGGAGGADFAGTELNLGGLGIDGLATRGWTAEARAGFDYHFPGTPMVAGVGVGYGTSTAEFNVTPGLINAQIQEHWGVWGRLGLASGRTLFYALAGYTEADASVSLFGGAFSASQTLKGWRAGLGVEHAITNNLIAGIEWTRDFYDTVSIGGGALTLDTERDRVMLTARFLFGGTGNTLADMLKP